MRPIIAVEQQPPKANQQRRPLNGPSTNSTNAPNRAATSHNPRTNQVKPRLYEPKTTAVPTNNRQLISQRTQKKPQPVPQKTAEVEIKISTVPERISAAEETFKNAVEKADSELAAIASELAFSGEQLDEAAEYCDKTDAYIDLHKFYSEMTDLSRKLAGKRDILQGAKSECLSVMHDYSRFLSKNLLPFRDMMEARLKAIHETIAVAKAAEEAERENMRLNPSLYKRSVETKEQSVQVRPESLIYFSPTAGLLRSTVKQRITLPASPVLKTGHDFTPTSSRKMESYTTNSCRRTVGQSQTSLTSHNGNVGVVDGYEDSVIATRPSLAPYPSHHASNSPFLRRLNFDDTAQDVENVTLRMGKVGEMHENSTLISAANDTIWYANVSKYETTTFLKPTMKNPVVPPQAPVLLSDTKNFY